jgi:hypothetical protein
VPNELDLLRNLGHELREPDEDSEERARELLQQRIDVARSDGGAGRARRPRLRWSLLIASAILLVGSALGFGLGSALTPSGSAGGNFVGFGFRPAQGWYVMQSGTLDETGKARAIAANVPLDLRDGLGGAPPTATLGSLPGHGVLVFATFSPRGDPTKDGDHPVREPPLQFEDAQRLTPTNDLARYRMRAGIGGYNVDARVYFGDGEPSAQATAAAQGQLDRLAVAADRVTIRVQPSIVSSRGYARVFGSVDSGRAGEDVKLQGKDCGRDFFHVVGGAVTREGGGWSTVYWQQRITTTLRAVWNDATSAEVLVRMRAFVGLYRRPAGRFEVRVFGRSVWRKRVFIQRFDRRLGTWQAVKPVVLTEDDGGTALASFTVSLPKGTRIRAVFPRSQTGPCYLAGTSPTLTT